MPKPDMIVIPNWGWFGSFQRPHHLAREFRQKFNVRIVGKRSLPQQHSIFEHEQRGLIDSVSNVYQFRGQKCAPIRLINEKFECLQYSTTLKKYLSNADVVWTWRFEDNIFLRYLDGNFIAYDAMDDWSSMYPHINQIVTANENALINRANVVFTVSAKLQNRIVKANPQTYLVPNGVEVDYFETALTYQKSPDDELYKFRDKKIVGYVGQIAKWVDVGLIYDCSMKLHDYIFVIVGPCDGVDLTRIKTLPNVYFTGAKPYSKLIGYIAYFDAGIIPFIVDTMNESTNPIKLFEYLGAGLPVISTPLVEVKKYEQIGVVATATGVGEFCDAIVDAIGRKTDIAAQNKRLEIARGNSWRSRATAIMNRLC
jgi:glycosyltransferase involved in cell wall biosynthesis